MMVEFETISGKKILVNPAMIVCVFEDNGNRCKMFLGGGDDEPWIVKGSIVEIRRRLWEQEKFN